VKLQKQLSRKVDDKEYPKYVVTIPPKHIAEVGWKDKAVREGKVDLVAVGRALLADPEWAMKAVKTLKRK
jgi:2,4-dienoyl-CoA reductase-like NADH-dependent reductase (Old Yellow Enzyme family)